MYRAGQLLRGDQLQAGDVLIFRPSEESDRAQRAIKGLQSLYPHSGGHADSTHVAICVGVSPEEEPLIAHLSYNEENKKLGYLQQTIASWEKSQNGNLRSFLVFRPRDAELANRVGKVAGDKEKYGMVKWKAYAGASAFLRQSFFSPDKSYPTQPYQREVNQESVCSKFVIQIYKAVVAEKDPQLLRSFMNLASATSPAKLESYLYNNENFDFYVCPGVNLYEILKEKMQGYIARLEKKGTDASKAKAAKLGAVLSETEKTLHGRAADSLMQAKLLLVNALPIIKLNTGRSVKPPAFYKEIMGLMKRRGIFQRDIDNFTADQMPRVVPNPIRMRRG